TYLRDLGYQVEEAGSGGAALELLEVTPGIDLLLVDFAMPGMNGRDLARRVRAKRAGLPILFITGFAQAEWAQEVSDKQIVRKPIDVEELSLKVRSSLTGEMLVTA